MLAAGWLRRHGYDQDADAAAAVFAAALDGLLLHEAIDPALRTQLYAIRYGN